MGDTNTLRTAAQAVVDEAAERERFEAYIRKDCGDLSTFGHGANMHYRNSAVNNAWGGWLAAKQDALRAALAQPEPAPTPALVDTSDDLQSFQVDISSNLQSGTPLKRLAAWLKGLPNLKPGALYWTNGVFADDCRDAYAALSEAIKPLSDERIRVELNRRGEMAPNEAGFWAGVAFAEQEHGIAAPSTGTQGSAE